MEKDKEEKKERKPGLWELRDCRFNMRKFKYASELWEAATFYFKWVDDNPWLQQDLVKYKGFSNLAEIPQSRPYTLSGLCFFLGVSESYFRVFKHNIREREAEGKAWETDADFADTIEAIEQVIETQQLEGAMVGAFNYNIVRAKLGLVDKQDVTSNGEAITNIIVRDKNDKKAIEELE